MSEYYWSFRDDTELWDNGCDSIEVCIEEARASCYGEDYEFVVIGELKKYQPTIDADDILDSLTENAYDECGESSDGWLDSYSKEEKACLETALNNVLEEWLTNTNNKPTFGLIVNIKCFDIRTGLQKI